MWYVLTIKTNTTAVGIRKAKAIECAALDSLPIGLTNFERIDRPFPFERSTDFLRRKIMQKMN